MVKNTISRRNFISALAIFGTLGIVIFWLKWKQKKQLPEKITSPDYTTGHRIKSAIANKSVSKSKIETVIVGGGASGLSAAWFLQQNNYTNFVVLELENEAAGNSAFGNENGNLYPLGAHYLPLPNNQIPELLDFLQQCGSILSIEQNIPVFNPEHICHHPSERLWIKGTWQSQLIPESGITATEKREIQEFFKLMETFKNAVGIDNLPPFNIPIALSSKDEKYTQLDRISMKQWLTQNGFKSEALIWYVNYCCADDFGANTDWVSAWAGIHYFASRKHTNKANAEVLTWENGNGFLITNLKKNIGTFIQSNTLVYHIKEVNENWEINIFDKLKNEYKTVVAKNIIMATPNYVNARIIKGFVQQPEFQYHPWLVSNYRMSETYFEEFQKPAWDNVLFGSSNLGYIYSGNQYSGAVSPNRYLTFYKAFANHSPKSCRDVLFRQLKANTTDDSSFILDMEKMHQGSSAHIEQIHHHVWGHGMIRPSVGFMHHRATQVNQFKGIQFVHTDNAGISIFEEAFYAGISSAKNILKT